MEAFLPQFGIAQRRTEQGRLIWIIDVITDGAEDEPRSAYFDERLGAWKLQSLERGRPSCTSPTPGTVVRHPWSASAPRKTDWTNALHPSEHAGFLLSLDWAATPLGPLKTWPRTLQLYTHMLLSDSRAAAIYWGPQRVAIYNDHWLPAWVLCIQTLWGVPSRTSCRVSGTPLVRYFIPSKKSNVVLPVMAWNFP